MLPFLANRNDKSMCNRLLVMWTKEEDDVLRDQVKVHGVDKWAKIATHLCGKSSRQCRRRWHMFLNVVNKRGGWSADEDTLLLEAHRKFGNRWTEIAKKLPGRTDNAVKNRFCVLCKKQTKEAGIRPLQRSVDTGSEAVKQKLQGRRFLEGPKAMDGMGGANKKMRTGAILNSRTPEVSLQQRPLEETLQQWKGLQSSELLTRSPQNHVPLEGSLQPWDSVQSNKLLQQKTQQERFHGGWKQLPTECKGSKTHQKIQLVGNLGQWEGSQSGVVVNDTESPKSSLQEEPQPLTVLQSQLPSLSLSSHPRLIMQENLPQLKKTNSREASSEPMHELRVLKKSNPSWSGAMTTDPAKHLQWWKEVDKNMMSNPALWCREVDEAFHHENLPPLSEMNSMATVYMPSSKQSTLESGIRRSSTLQSGQQAEHLQQSRAGGMQKWDQLLAKEASNTSQLRSKENTHHWQDWNSNEASRQSPCQHGLIKHNLQTHDQSAETISFEEASVKCLPLWISANSQRAPGSIVLHRPEEHETQHWNHSNCETSANSPHHIPKDTVQQWEKSEASGNPGPIMSILNCFSGSGNKEKNHSPCAKAERKGDYKAQIIEESWKTAMEKLKSAPTTFTAESQIHNPREVLGFEEYMLDGSTDIDVKKAAVFPPVHVMIPTHQASPAEDSTWELQTNLKGAQHREMHAAEGLLPGNCTTCETRIDLHGGANDGGVELMTIEGQASGVTQSPPCIPTDGAHSPTQSLPRSHLTMECMHSPQFTDSEKEFLLSTLEQTSTNCWSSSPLRHHSRFSKVRNPLLDIRYDTPAGSPLSSCILRQFQVSEASHLI